MKQIKKIFALVLALMLVLGIATTAYAAVNDDSGEITIDNAVVGQTYDVYQILVLESYNATSGAYSYKAADAWKDFIASDAIKDVYLKTDDQGYVTWVENADAAEFAKLAQAYAKDNEISATQSKKAESTTVKFTGLNLGYYLVDTTLGTICSLDTTDNTVTIKEKNQAPSLDKEVQEDSDNSWGDDNDADFAQKVEFKTTVTAYAGAENYILHDTMSEGLTYNEDVVIKVGDKTLVKDTDYTVSTTNADECTFELSFTKEFLNTVTVTAKDPTKIVITYSATVNDKAVVGLPGNPNKTHLSYGELIEGKPGFDTPEDKTITYTWDMDVLKYGNGDESNVLADAKFVLLNSTKDKVATAVAGKLTGWVDVPTDGVWPANTELTTDAEGKIMIDGLDADTYYLRETAAPAGYNKLDKDIEVVVTGATPNDSDELVYETVVEKVNNQAGTVLPETGGIGTTIFYAIGGLLVVAAVVLLVTKKRMASAE